ncbi:MAG: xanthine dehydrogenase family protein molybdopterin-binding subunit [Marinobacter sp.]|uniref:xanthine dehydrogenase family protein molybdopterin-binding subunit n=1 Tax=Marinobacter sp. TaxID=50741 RepID=UPI00299E54E3|nr:xanthine dehydrogenase family protein molybdopterin-binding subunit [Marinobacter sp.]MDX1757650.1 xanthine dehydrogenase family protein molybdopterin-binding subunit [Marinobacter sp.]
MGMNRRDFLKVSVASSGGLLLSLNLAGCSGIRTGYQEDSGSWRPDAWLEIGRDNQIYFTLARVEMGQGTYSGLTTLIAEELEVAPAAIQPRFAPVAREYRNPLYKLQLTGGSTSLATSWQPLRVAGASARIVLIKAAARVWQVPAEDCRARDGRIWHPNGEDSLTYGQLVELAAGESAPDEPPLKSPDQWRYIGKGRGRLDSRAKVTGTAEYGIDVELPGMVYGVVTRPPRYGARVDSFDAREAKAMPGVIDVFAIERGVAVVADKYWRARKALETVAVQWDNADALNVSSESVMDFYRQAADDDAGEEERGDGDVARAIESADRVIEASYEQPYLAHATLEPMNATAVYHDRGMEVWAPTQAPDLGRIAAARVTDLSPDEVTIHTTFLGGGFGRRLTQDFIEEAAAIAYRVRRPVKLIWSREDDTRHDLYRPAMLHRLKASLADGRVTGWQHQLVGPQILDWYVRNAAPAQYPWAPKFLYGTLGSVGLAAEGIITPKDMSAIEGAVDYPYRVDNVEVRHTHADPGVPVTWWRSVGHSHNAFAVETFMDEIAHQLGQDPYGFRRDLIQHEPRHLAVLERAAELGDWGQPLPSGRARGIALHRSFGTYVAQVVEASVDNGEIRVHRVACAVDCGQVVNPDIVRDQIESGVIFGLTAALYGHITFEDGAVRESNFHDYQLLRTQQRPVVDIAIVESEEAPTGVGEPGVPPVIPALGNALFALTGKRQRSLPLTARPA